nr:GGDEF domain-containing protein [Massilia sp. Dwa41.01b]
MHTAAATTTAPDSHRPPSWFARLGDILLGSDSLQRLTLSLLGLAGLITATVVGLLCYMASIGVAGVGQIEALATMFLLFMGGFYTFIRSGLNRRFADPTLALPQTVIAQSLIAAGYTMTGSVHGATVIMLALVMVFGMFSLRPAALRAVCLYTVAIMGLVTWWCAHHQPATYPPHVELFNFALTAIVMLAISQLSGQLMDMRTRLKTQKIALQEALAHIKEMAARDELTGLPNRRRMMTLLQEHATRHARGGPRFLVCIIDLDHFKSINDTYGHAAGDAVLRAFANQAQAVLRTTDMIGRWGGEEFLLLLPETPPGDPTGRGAPARHAGGQRLGGDAAGLARAFLGGTGALRGWRADRPGDRTGRPCAVRGQVGRAQPQRRALKRAGR